MFCVYFCVFDFFLVLIYKCRKSRHCVMLNTNLMKLQNKNIPCWIYQLTKNHVKRGSGIGYFNMSKMRKCRHSTGSSRVFPCEKHARKRKKKFFLYFRLPQSKILTLYPLPISGLKQPISPDFRGEKKFYWQI